MVPKRPLLGAITARWSQGDSPAQPCLSLCGSWFSKEGSSRHQRGQEPCQARLGWAHTPFWSLSQVGSSSGSRAPGLSWGASSARQRSPQLGQQLTFGLRHSAPSQLGLLPCLAPLEGTLERGGWPFQRLDPLSRSRGRLPGLRAAGSSGSGLCADRPGFTRGSALSGCPSSATLRNLFIFIFWFLFF